MRLLPDFFEYIPYSVYRDLCNHFSFESPKTIWFDIVPRYSLDLEINSFGGLNSKISYEDFETCAQELMDLPIQVSEDCEEIPSSNWPDARRTAPIFSEFVHDSILRRLSHLSGYLNHLDDQGDRILFEDAIQEAKHGLKTLLRSMTLKPLSYEEIYSMINLGGYSIDPHPILMLHTPPLPRTQDYGVVKVFHHKKSQYLLLDKLGIIEYLNEKFSHRDPSSGQMYDLRDQRSEFAKLLARICGHENIATLRDNLKDHQRKEERFNTDTQKEIIKKVLDDLGIVEKPK